MCLDSYEISGILVAKVLVRLKRKRSDCLLITNAFKKWLAWFLVLVLAAFVVPYTLLSSVEKIYGAFLFWVIFAIIAIISVEAITRSWRD